MIWILNYIGIPREWLISSSLFLGYQLYLFFFFVSCLHISKGVIYINAAKILDLSQTGIIDQRVFFFIDIKYDN